MIQGTLRAFPNNKARQRALKAIRWRLRGPRGEFVGLHVGLTCGFVPEGNAIVFDGRDNEQQKLRYYQNALGERLTVEILPQVH